MRWSVIFGTMLASITLLASPVFAIFDTESMPTGSSPASASTSPASESIQGRLDAIATNAGYTLNEKDTGLSKYIGKIINVAMSLLGVIFVAQMVYAGYLWMTARDEADQLEKAKHIIRRSIVGLAIVLSAWAIAAFVIIRLSEAAAV